MGKRICTVQGCEGPYRSRGWCHKHYEHWRKHGVAVTAASRLPMAERFWTKVDKGDGTGCWLWTDPLDEEGYGHFAVSHSRKVSAHRYAYTLLVGPIPEGLTLDHVKANGCTSTACVKAIADEHGPAHLEPVTQRENLLRGDTFQAANAAKTHCPQGHPYDEANTGYSRGRKGIGRRCLTCHRVRARAQREQRGEKDR